MKLEDLEREWQEKEDEEARKRVPAWAKARDLTITPGPVPYVVPEEYVTPIAPIGAPVLSIARRYEEDAHLDPPPDASMKFERCSHCGSLKWGCLKYFKLIVCVPCFRFCYPGETPD